MPAPRLFVLLAAAATLVAGARAAAVGAGGRPPSALDRVAAVSVPAPAVTAEASVVSAVTAPVAPPARTSPATPSGAGSTGWPALDAAIRRIPGYGGAAPATWSVSGRSGHYGSTYWYVNTIDISPSVPTRLLDSVVRHEWSHLLQTRAYSGDLSTLVSSLNAAFGGPGPSGVDGVEKAADCMALQLGATWTHYTSCRNRSWQAGAATLRAGHRL